MNLLQIYTTNPNFQNVIENFRFLIDIFGINANVLKFPDFIFFLVIPLVVSAYAIHVFIKNLRIFRRTNIVSRVFGVIISLIFLRFIYPVVFFISLFYLIFIKAWPRKILYRIFFIVFILILYLIVLPFFSNLSLSF